MSRGSDQGPEVSNYKQTRLQITTGGVSGKHLLGCYYRLLSSPETAARSTMTSHRNRRVLFNVKSVVDAERCGTRSDLSHWQSAYSHFGAYNYSGKAAATETLLRSEILSANKNEKRKKIRQSQRLLNNNVGHLKA